MEAFVLVYSVIDRHSFDKSVDLLYDIRKKHHHKTAVILVANKTDLKRARCVDEQGKLHLSITSLPMEIKRWMEIHQHLQSSLHTKSYTISFEAK